MRRAWLLMLAVWWLSGIGAFSLVTRFGQRPFMFWTGDRLWSLALVAVIGVFTMSLIVFVRRVMSPIGDIVGAAHRVADGDLTTRVPTAGPPAIRAVATAFNDMAERLASQEKQRRELMADIAHELRTPLSVVQGRLEGLIDGVYPTDASQLEPLLEETRVLARVIDDLRTMANAESGVLTLQKEPTDIDMLLRDAVAAVRDEAARQSTAIAIADHAPMPAVNVDPLRLRQVIVNLLLNAIRHGAGSPVRVAADVDNATLTICVEDKGRGIAADELPHVFERFYKRRGSSGSGLGLTIARMLVRAHGGAITAESVVDAGTTMTIKIPL
jgi:signal transduction histidine kinase